MFAKYTSILPFRDEFLFLKTTKWPQADPVCRTDEYVKYHLAFDYAAVLILLDHY